MTRQALGRGPEALLPPPRASALVELTLEDVYPNPLQPRLHFQPQKLEELAASIKENGVLQPIVVRQRQGSYQIVAGERRWRASQKAGLRKIPAIIQDVSDEKMLAMTLVENIQRDDLSPIEEAHAYQLFLEEFQLTQEEIAQKVGRSRASVTNSLRLLRLPKSIQALLINGQISMGHARALVPLTKKDQRSLAKKILLQGLSVRQVEQYARRQQKAQSNSAVQQPKDSHLAAAEQALEESWKTRVQIRRRGDGGQIIIHFHSPDELNDLYERLSSRARAR